MIDNEKTKNIEINEYNALRAEIISKQEKRMDVWLQMYILFIALFSLGVETDNEVFFLLTYLITIPYQVMVNNCEWNVSRISAYIHIFYEKNNQAMRWEAFNKNYPEYINYFLKKVAGLPGFIRQSGSIHLGLLATVFYILKVLDIEYRSLNQIEPFEWISILFSLILLLIIFFIDNPNERVCDEELIAIIENYKNTDDNFENNDQLINNAKMGWRKKMIDSIKTKLKLK